MANENVREARAALQTNRQVPVVDLIRKDPGTAAMISKLVSSTKPAEFDQSGKRKITQPDFGTFKVASDRVAQSSADAQTVIQLLPDLAAAKEILVSSIISPKDMTSNELIYLVTEDAFPPEVSAALLGLLRTHFDKDYKIKKFLPKIIGNTLFMTGSYPVAVIPENSLDEMINSNRTVTMEALAPYRDSATGHFRPVGFLGDGWKPESKRKPMAFTYAYESYMNTVRPSAATTTELKYEDNPDEMEYLTTAYEDMKNPGKISITDNFNVLKIPELNQKLLEQRVIDAIGGRSFETLGMKQFGMESDQSDEPTGQGKSTLLTGMTKLSDREQARMIYKERKFTFKPMTILKTQDQLMRRAIGDPLVLHLPSESVIPVFIPGSMDKHIGYFLLVDINGNPIRREDDVNYYQQLSTRLNSNANFSSAMIAKVKRQMDGLDMSSVRHLDYSINVWAEMLERDLGERIRNGMMREEMNVSLSEEISRVMLMRALQQQHTQLVFIPSELMTYFAINYNNDGTGRSILEDLKVINSLRVMLLFSNVMASIRNSIGRTEVKMKLDEDDPDPQKTVEIMIHEIMRSKGQSFPLGTNNPAELVTYLQKAAYEFTFEGHPGLPDLQIEYSEKNTQYVKPDTELETEMRNRSLMGTTVPPEIVDNSQRPEFATTATLSSIMFSKRVMNFQDQLAPFISDHIRKKAFNTQGLLDSMIEVVKANLSKIEFEENEHPNQQYTDEQKAHAQLTIAKSYLQQFLLSVSVEFPRPDTVTLENQKTSFEAYEGLLDKSLSYYLGSEIMASDLGGEAANHIESLKAIAKAQFIRQWMADNNVMPEVAKMITLDKEGKTSFALDEQAEKHVENIMKSVGDILKKLQKAREKSDAKIQGTGAEEGAAPASGGEGEQNDDGSNADNELDNLFADDTSTDNTANADETPETPAEEETPPASAEPEGNEAKPAGGEATGNEKPEA